MHGGLGLRAWTIGEAACLDGWRDRVPEREKRLHAWRLECWGPQNRCLALSRRSAPCFLLPNPTVPPCSSPRSLAAPPCLFPVTLLPAAQPCHPAPLHAALFPVPPLHPVLSLRLVLYSPTPCFLLPRPAPPSLALSRPRRAPQSRRKRSFRACRGENPVKKVKAAGIRISRFRFGFLSLTSSKILRLGIIKLTLASALDFSYLC